MVSLRLCARGYYIFELRDVDRRYSDLFPVERLGLSQDCRTLLLDDGDAHCSIEQVFQTSNFLLRG
jgi:hypothetical protein